MLPCRLSMLWVPSEFHLFDIDHLHLLQTSSVQEHITGMKKLFQHFLCKIFYYCKVFFFAFGYVQILSGFHYLNSKGSSACAMKLRANSNIFACNQNILRIFWINCGGIQFSSNVEYWHSETDWIPEATNSPNIFEKILVFQGMVKFTSQLLEVPQKCFDI